MLWGFDGLQLVYNYKCASIGRVLVLFTDVDYWIALSCAAVTCTHVVAKVRVLSLDQLKLECWVH